MSSVWAVLSDVFSVTPICTGQDSINHVIFRNEKRGHQLWGRHWWLPDQLHPPRWVGSARLSDPVCNVSDKFCFGKQFPFTFYVFSGLINPWVC